jgi:hypothetical protein
MLLDESVILSSVVFKVDLGVGVGVEGILPGFIKTPLA